MTMLSVNPLAPLANFDQDILTELLRDKRSPNTRHTYSKGLKDFFVTMTQFEPSPDAVAWFLSLGRFQAIACNQDCIGDRIKISCLILRQ
jgi:integrase/recombinase XerC